MSGRDGTAGGGAPRVAATGAAGMLGTELVRECAGRGVPLAAWDLPDFDLTDRDATMRAIEAARGRDPITVAAGITPSGIIHVGNFREIQFPVTDVPLGASAREFRAHAVVDAAGLPSGRYVLRVELLDLETNMTAITEMPFSKVEDEVLRRILMAER